VTFPGAGNIGGGGFMVIRMAGGRTTTIDYREKAPAAAQSAMFLDEKGNFVPSRSQEGYLASGVPGSVAGMLMALQRYGKLSRKTVLKPAIDLAARGFRLSHEFVDELKADMRDILKYPSSARAFTKGGKPYEEGDLFVQRVLALTLQRIQKNG
jgi:gamma-glutamyltranspeptidase/glutathione hydrolase